MIYDMSIEGMADAMKALAATVFSQGENSQSQPSLMKDANNSKDIAKSEIGELDDPSFGDSWDGKICMIGHSMGGYIALAFAEKYPDTLNSFGLFHSTAFADSEEKKTIRCKGIKFIEQQGGYEFLKTSIPNLYSPIAKAKRAHLIEEQLNSVCNVDDAALVSYYGSMMQREERSEVLRNSQVPVLFILGKYDTAVPLADGLKQCHLPQLSYIHILDESGHMGMVEEEMESNKILSKFITTVENIAYT